MASHPGDGNAGVIRKALLRRRLRLAAAVAVPAVFLFFGLDRSPLVWIDEAVYAAPAYELSRFGRFTCLILGDARQCNEAFFLNTPLYGLWLALGYALLGFDIWTTRLFSLLPLFGVGLLAYFFLRRETGSERSGLLALLLLISHLPLVESARSGRPDSLMLLFFLAAAALAIWGTRQRGRIRMWAIGGAGLCAGLAFLSHIAGILAVVPPVFALVTASPMPEEDQRRDLLFVLGGFTMVLIPYAGYAAAHTEAFRDQMGANTIKVFFRAAGDGGLPGVLAERLWKNNWAVYSRSPLSFFPYLLVPLAGLFWWRSVRADGLRATLLAWAILFPLATSVSPLGQHGFVPVVLACLICGYAAAPGGLDWSPRVRRAAAALAAAAVLWQGAVAYGGRAATVVVGWDSRDPAIPARLIAEHVPPAASVAGPPDIFYAALGQGRGFQLISALCEPCDKIDFVVTSGGRLPPSGWLREGERWVRVARAASPGMRVSDAVPALRFLDSSGPAGYDLTLWSRGS